jgi:thioredoxin-related protein
MKTETLLVIIVFGLILIYLIYKNEKFNNLSTDVVSNTELNDNTDVNKNNKPVLGVYYTNWCGYSRNFISDLQNGLQKNLANYVDVNLIDCEKDENKELCNKLGVRGFPTIILHTQNENIMYNGDRSHDDLMRFVQ